MTLVSVIGVSKFCPYRRCISVVERQLPKRHIAGSIPIIQYLDQSHLP